MRRLADDPDAVLLDPSTPGDYPSHLGLGVLLAAFALTLARLKDTALRFVLSGPLWLWRRSRRRRARH